MRVCVWISALSAALVGALALAVSAASADEPPAAWSERAQYIAALGDAKTDIESAQAARALAQFYWSNGLLAESTAALVIAAGSESAALRDPRHRLTLTARGLEDDALLRAQSPLWARLLPREEAAIAHFIIAGRRAEISLERANPSTLARAGEGVRYAPDWARRRFAPALADAAAAIGTQSLAALFAQAAADAPPAAAAFARGRAAEARRDVDTALAAYAEARRVGHAGRDRWVAQATLASAALRWAEGDLTPAEAAVALEDLLLEWPDNRLSAQALPALARAYQFAARPDAAAAVLIQTVRRHRDTRYAAIAISAAETLDGLLNAVIVEERFPEIGLAGRIALFAAARPYAASPFGALAADAIHLDALTRADLPEEIVRLTADTDAFPLRRRMAAARLALAQAAARETDIAAVNTPAEEAVWTPGLAPRATPAARARDALLALDDVTTALEGALMQAAGHGDLTAATPETAGGAS